MSEGEAWVLERAEKQAHEQQVLQQVEVEAVVQVAQQAGWRRSGLSHNDGT